jgi:hypothetical protein
MDAVLCGCVPFEDGIDAIKERRNEKMPKI